MTPRRCRLLVVAAAIAGARWAAAAPLSADPTVRVVELAVNGTGSGTITLGNPGTSAVVATGIVAAPGCDADAVHAAPLTGFTLAPGAPRPITISCSAAPASMRRCTYQVRGAGQAVLGEFEAVCAYAGAPSLTPTPAMVDLGAIAVGATAVKPVTLRNAGAAFDRVFVEITDLTGSFAVAAPCNPDAHACDAAVPSVALGGTLALAVTCTPRTRGPVSAELHVATSTGARLTAPVMLTCSGLDATAPVLAATPSVIDVGAVEQVGATAGATVHLTNPGPGTVTLRDVQIADSGTGAAADWSYVARATRTTCDPAIPPDCPLEGSATVDLALTFDPSAIGVRDATLLVNYHDTADRSLSIPLRGTGDGATLELVGGVTALDFGGLPLGSTAALTVGVINRGSRPLTDATVALAPPLAGLAASPAALAVVRTATVTVTCTPTAAGTLTSDLVIGAPDVATAPLHISVRCTGDPAATLTATPPAVLLGEVRTGGSTVAHVAIASVGAPVGLDSAKLMAQDPRLTLTGAPATTPATLTLVATPGTEGPLTNQLVVTPVSGTPLTAAITGTAVTAGFATDDVVSLGTFCVEQPTTPRTLVLASSGTATIGLTATPALQRADSPFDLVLISPPGYPASLAPATRALVAVTPKRQATPGVVTDALVWTTDVAGLATATTRLSAAFIDDGGAIAPAAISFPQTVVHLDSGKPRQVTLQNCSLFQLALDTPQIAAPFSIDSPNFPSALQPGETASFSVGFHPTRRGNASTDLVIPSPQLPGTPLKVSLFGVGVADDGSGGSAVPDSALDATSFYACGSCASSPPSSALALLAAAFAVVLPRRRRR